MRLERRVWILRSAGALLAEDTLPTPFLLACLWGACTLNRWTWVSSISYLHQRNLNVHLYFGASLYRSQGEQKGNALWPRLIRAQLVDNPSCRLGTGNMRRNVCVLPWCSCCPGTHGALFGRSVPSSGAWRKQLGKAPCAAFENC